MVNSSPRESRQFTCQLLAIPYPGRGHINPMMNLCKLIAKKRPNILINFIITEEWFGFIGSESRPENIRFGTIPNVIPSEIGRAKVFHEFVEAVMTKMEGPVEELIDELEPPLPSVILYDTFMSWVTRVANRRNIPAASFWTQSATAFSIFNHFDVLLQKGHIPFKLQQSGAFCFSKIRLASFSHYFNFSIYNYTFFLYLNIIIKIVNIPTKFNLKFTCN